jgi:hypothetical protein
MEIAEPLGLVAVSVTCTTVTYQPFVPDALEMPNVDVGTKESRKPSASRP